MSDTTSKSARARRIREAYFNTTEGILAGHPDDEDTAAAMKLLNDAGIAYLHNNDRSLPRPIFTSQGEQYCGIVEIAQWVADVEASAASHPSARR